MTFSAGISATIASTSASLAAADARASAPTWTELSARMSWCGNRAVPAPPLCRRHMPPAPRCGDIPRGTGYDVAACLLAAGLPPAGGWSMHHTVSDDRDGCGSRGDTDRVKCGGCAAAQAGGRYDTVAITIPRRPRGRHHYSKRSGDRRYVLAGDRKAATATSAAGRRWRHQRSWRLGRRYGSRSTAAVGMMVTNGTRRQW